MKNNAPLSQHLHDAGETYLQHMAFTMKMAAMLIGSGLAVLIHGFLPFMFTHTGSRMIERLNTILQERKAACRKRQSGHG